MGLSLYDQNLLNQMHNDIKLRLPETMKNFESSVKKLTINQELMEDYMIIEAIKLDRELPLNQRVFNRDEVQRCLQKVKENYLRNRK